MKETLRSYIRTLRWYEIWRLPKIAYLYVIDTQFNKQRAEFYLDLSKAIADKESLPTWLERSSKHWRKYRQVGLADYFLAMQANLSKSGLYGMLNGLVPSSDLMSLKAIDECQTTEEKVNGLTWLAHTVRQQAELKKLARSAVGIFFYVGPMIIALLILIGLEILPLIEQMMPYEKWPTEAKILWWSCRIWIDYWYLTIPTVAGTVIFYLTQFAWWKGSSRAWFDQSSLLINLPHKFHAQYMSSVLLVALADLLRSKKILSNALSMISENGSPFLRWHITQINRNINSGQGNTAQAFETGLLSPAMLLRLRNYCEKKDFDVGLIDISQRGFEHIKEEVKKSSETLNFISLIFVGLVIVFVYLVSISLMLQANDFSDALRHMTQ